MDFRISNVNNREAGRGDSDGLVGARMEREPTRCRSHHLLGLNEDFAFAHDDNDID